MRLRLGKNPTETSETFLKVTSFGYYPRQVAIEFALNLVPPNEAQKREIQKVPFYIPNHQTYTDDIHVTSGKALFKKLLPRILAGENVSMYGYDMRWSGTIFGGAWRLSAFRQHGTKMQFCAWKDVVIPYRVRDIIALDRFFYGHGLIPPEIIAPSLSQ